MPDVSPVFSSDSDASIFPVLLAEPFSPDQTLREQNTQLQKRVLELEVQLQTRDNRSSTDTQNLPPEDQRLNLALEAAQAAVFYWDIPADCVEWSPSLYEQFKRRPEEFGGTSEDTFRFLHPDDEVRVRKAIKDALRGREEISLEYSILWPDGTIRYIALRGKIYFDEAGTPLRMTGTTVDVTEHYVDERALWNSKQRIENILENIPDGLVTVDRQWRLTYLNRVASTFLAGDGDFLGCELWEVAPALIDSTTQHELRRAMNEQVTAQRELFIESLAAWMEITAHPCNDGLVISCRDISERKRNEKAQRQLTGRLVAAQEDERRRVSRELHDELGQQLTALKMGLDSFPDFHSDSLGSPSLNRNVEQLQAMTEELMQRVHQLAWELRPAALDDLGLEAALGRYVEEWARRCPEVQLDFHTRGFERVPPLDETLQITFYRVIQESLTNVLRHSEAKRASVVLERRDHQLIAIIEDNGHGFDVESTLTENTRLGILGMRERLELVGGTLTIESEPGGGTAVFARVPVAFESKATVPQKSAI